MNRLFRKVHDVHASDLTVCYMEYPLRVQEYSEKHLSLQLKLWTRPQTCLYESIEPNKEMGDFCTH